MHGYGPADLEWPVRLARDGPADADLAELGDHELSAVHVVADGAHRHLDVHAVRVVLLDELLGLGDILVLGLAAAGDLVDLLEGQGEFAGQLGIEDAARHARPLERLGHQLLAVDREVDGHRSPVKDVKGPEIESSASKIGAYWRADGDLFHRGSRDCI